MKTARRQLLLVEDGGLSHALVPRLEERGWIVRSCTSVREAIYAAQAQRVDALIVAMHLPDEPGTVAFYHIATQYPPVRRRTVFLVRDVEEQKAVTANGRRCIQLPSDPEQIMRVLDEVCGLR